MGPFFGVETRISSLPGYYLHVKMKYRNTLGKTLTFWVTFPDFWPNNVSGHLFFFDPPPQRPVWTPPWRQLGTNVLFRYTAYPLL